MSNAEAMNKATFDAMATMQPHMGATFLPELGEPEVTTCVNGCCTYIEITDEANGYTHAFGPFTLPQHDEEAANHELSKLVTSAKRVVLAPFN